MMKKFEILWELPEHDTETQSEQMLLKNGTDRFPGWSVATNFQFVKNIVSAKCNKAKFNKMRYACIDIILPTSKLLRD